MLKKVKNVAIAAIAVCAIGSLAAATRQTVSAEGETMRAAEVVAIDTSTIGAWEGNYGKDGYVVFADIEPSDVYGGRNWTNQAGFYSSFYNGIGKKNNEIIYGVNNDGANREISSVQTYMSVYGYTGNGYGIDETAPISRWNYATTSWWGTGNRPHGLYAPGTDTYMNFTTGFKSCVKNDTSLLFTLKNDNLTYVSVYIFGQSDMGKTDNITETNAVEVMVYPTAKNETHLKQQKGTSGAANLDSFYGAKPLAKTTVTEDGAYVTFALQGAGDYQIVVTDDNTDDNSEGVTWPVFGGFFFDSEINRKAETVQTDCSTKSAWEGKYGKDGYVIFANIKNGAYGGKHFGNQSGFYSSFYGDIGRAADEVIYGVNSFDRRHDAEQAYMSVYNDNTAGYGIDSKAPISRWNYTTVVWYGNESATDRPYGLYAPGKSVPMDFLTNYESAPRQDKSLLITLKDDKLTYVTVYIFDQTYEVGSGKSNLYEGHGVDLMVYPTARNAANLMSKVGTEGSADLDAFYGAKPLAKTTITNDGTYVTFALQGKGDYQIVVADDNTDDNTAAVTQPTIAGVFFDYSPMELKVDSWSLTLDGTIGVNLYTQVPAYRNKNGAHFVFSYNDSKTDVALPEAESDGTYKFTLQVAAKDYADTITAQYYETDDETNSLLTLNFSVVQYCDKVIANVNNVYDQKLINLCKSLKEYGNAAAHYFEEAEYNASQEVANTIADDFKDYGLEITEGATLPEGIAIKSVSLLLKSETTLRFYVSGVTSAEDLQVLIDGKQVGLAEENGKWYVQKENISAQNLAKIYTIQIKTSTTNYEFKCGVFGYALAAFSNGANQDLLNVLAAMRLYNVAAEQYFNQEV